MAGGRMGRLPRAAALLVHPFSRAKLWRLAAMVVAAKRQTASSFSRTGCNQDERQMEASGTGRSDPVDPPGARRSGPYPLDHETLSVQSFGRLRSTATNLLGIGSGSPLPL